MKASPNAHLRYVDHPLNVSKSKSSYSFRRSERFVQEKSFSPNKFYDIPSSLGGRASTMGFGKKTGMEKSDFIEPSRYRISSDFEKKQSSKPKFTTFGINRQEYYKGRSITTKPGPGTYQIPQKYGKSGGYMCSRFQPPMQKHNSSACTYDINGGIRKLSTLSNDSNGFRIKTEYYPKSKYYYNKTGTPGPGSYYQQATILKHNKSQSYLYGEQQRIKKQRPNKIGPGSYTRFSQFGLS